jgi:eukaryotic-like serine/threonine-protein kinase
VVRQLIEATLNKDPRQRYQTGGEFAAAVAAVRRGDPLPLPGQAMAPTERVNPATRVAPAMRETSPPRGAERPDRWAARPEEPRRRGPWGTVAALALVALLLVAGVIWVVNSTETSDPPPPAPTTTTTTTTTAPSSTTTRSSRTTTTTASGNTVTVNPVEYLGRSAQTASAGLRQLGLDPEVSTVLGGQPDNESACRVLSVSPTGEVPRGSTVSVTCQEF